MKMSGKSRRTANTNVREFENFFKGWLVRHEHYLEELQSTCDESNDEDLRDLIARVIAHYQQYYEEKSRIANHDVSLVFSPPWFSPFEQSFFWIAGFKPGLGCRVVGSSVEDMSEEQAKRMESLKVETKAEERELESELARIQESIAAPPMVEVATSGDNSPGDDKYNKVRMESVIATLRAEMELVLAKADMLRSRTAQRVMEILTPVQNVKFLAAMAELQLTIRRWGSQIDGGKDDE